MKKTVLAQIGACITAIAIFAGMFSAVPVLAANCPSDVTNQAALIREYKTTRFTNQQNYDAFVLTYVKFLRFYKVYTPGSKHYELQINYTGTSPWTIEEYGTYNANNPDELIPLIATYPNSTNILPPGIRLNQAELNAMGFAARQESDGVISEMIPQLHYLVEYENACNTRGDLAASNSWPTQTGNTNNTASAPSAQSLIGSTLSATGNSAVDVIVKSYSSTSTSATITFTMRIRQAIGSVIIGGYDADPANIPLDNSHPNNAHIIPSIFTNNSRPVGREDTPSPVVISGLQPGTIYYLQLKDTLNDVTYQKISFTTTGTPVAPTNVPTVQNTEVTLPSPENHAVSSAPGSKYEANFKGTIQTTGTFEAALDLYMGENPWSHTRVATVLPKQQITANTPKEFTYKKTNLDPGKTYYYRIVETTQNLQFPTYSFVTDGNPVPSPSTPVPIFDPDTNTGSLFEYNFPTQLGEPTGDINTPVTDVPTLVPCGKSTDVGTPDENCGFRHVLILVGNLITFLLAMMVPLTVLMCVYVGVQLILHRKVPGELQEYKTKLLRVLVGLAVIILAWTIVVTVMKTMLGDDASRYILLDILP